MHRTLENDHVANARVAHRVIRLCTLVSDAEKSECEK